MDEVTLAGARFRAGRWSAGELERLTARLAGDGNRALAAIADGALLAAWSDAVEAFLDPRSPERHDLEAALVRSTGLSPPGLTAGLAAVLGGVRGTPARELLARASGQRRAGIPGAALAGGQPAPRRGPALAVLAGNLPALAVQPLLAALALRRPLLLKSASAEPLFAPAFVDALRQRLPALGEGIAAVTWRGGDEALEAPVLAGAERVLAYGDRAAVASLARRAAGKVVGYGPKLSFAALAADADLETAARGIARDVALFEQRGCLSVQAVFAAGEARTRSFAALLLQALDAIAAELPPGPVEAAHAARVQQVRGEAELRGALVGRSRLDAGTVIVETADAPLLPSPGLRTVRVYPLADLAELPARLAAWHGQLQGAALAGAAAWQLAPALATLGVSRCAAPGELQSPDAGWHNGGHDPLAALGT